jgi:two-component system NarL family response regulator
VFLVDDHPLMRLALRRIIESDEHFIVAGEADNAEECLACLETLAVDMVVMDIQLPGMNGVEATRQLKARHPNLKVVIISAYGEEYLILSIDAGADGYMLKGLTVDQVVQGLLQAAAGTPPIDATLTRHLMDRAAVGTQDQAGPSLSPRQQEVLRHVSDGLTSKEIASRLNVSATTVKREFRSIFEALGVNDRAHAIAEAYRRSLI